MKYILSIFCLILFWGQGEVKSQSLSFSQVLVVNIAEDTVPAGKVWKVENYFQSELFYTTLTESNTCNVPGYHHPIFINGARYWLGETSGINSPGNVNHFPLWLPAGYRLRTSCTNDLLSVIEFNVTP